MFVSSGGSLSNRAPLHDMARGQGQVEYIYFTVTVDICANRVRSLECGPFHDVARHKGQVKYVDFAITVGITEYHDLIFAGERCSR
jgi:hypothetical protein